MGALWARIANWACRTHGAFGTNEANVSCRALRTWQTLRAGRASRTDWTFRTRMSGGALLPRRSCRPHFAAGKLDDDLVFAADDLDCAFFNDFNDGISHR